MLSGYSCRLRHFSISFRNCVTFIWLFQFLRGSIRQCWQRVQAIVNDSPCENDALMAFRIIPRYYGVTKTHFQSPKIIANSEKKKTLTGTRRYWHGGGSPRGCVRWMGGGLGVGHRRIAGGRGRPRVVRRAQRVQRIVEHVRVPRGVPLLQATAAQAALHRAATKQQITLNNNKTIVQMGELIKCEL